MLTRFFYARRKIITLSILAGFAVTLLVGSVQFFFAWHLREDALDRQMAENQTRLGDYFKNLKATTALLQPFLFVPCTDIASELTSRAAFSLNVRAFLLIKEGNAVCSSATGALDVPLDDLVPGLDLTKPVDMQILTGTPMMPESPAFAVWFKHDGEEESGVFASLNMNVMPYLIRQEKTSDAALVVGNRAMTTWSDAPLTLQDIPRRPVRTAGVNGLPITIWLFADKWTPQAIQSALLSGLIAGLLSALLCVALLRRRLRPGRDILRGIKHNQFYVVYQPVVKTDTLRVNGVEVLLRWKHPTKGDIPPDTFIPQAEAQKLIVPLTLHLFTLIASDAPALQQLLPAGAKLGVNIAPGHLHSASFKEDISRFSASLPASHFSLVLEITERDMLKQSEAIALFQWLHNEGYEIAIDDFGTGHSALIYLERFTLDYLKIDRGFVRTLESETGNSPVLDAVMLLAKRLNMLMVAEGVETPEQAKWLRAHGVHFMQGYYFCRPMTLTQFSQWQTPPFADWLAS